MKEGYFTASELEVDDGNHLNISNDNISDSYRSNLKTSLLNSSTYEDWKAKALPRIIKKKKELEYQSKMKSQKGSEVKSRFKSELKAKRLLEINDIADRMILSNALQNNLSSFECIVNDESSIEKLWKRMKNELKCEYSHVNDLDNYVPKNLPLNTSEFAIRTAKYRSSFPSFDDLFDMKDKKFRWMYKDKDFEDNGSPAIVNEGIPPDEFFYRPGYYSVPKIKKGQSLPGEEIFMKNFRQLADAVFLAGIRDQDINELLNDQAVVSRAENSSSEGLPGRTPQLLVLTHSDKEVAHDELPRFCFPTGIDVTISPISLMRRKNSLPPISPQSLLGQLSQNVRRNSSGQRSPQNRKYVFLLKNDKEYKYGICYSVPRVHKFQDRGLSVQLEYCICIITSFPYINYFFHILEQFESSGGLDLLDPIPQQEHGYPKHPSLRYLSDFARSLQEFVVPVYNAISPQSLLSSNPVLLGHAPLMYSFSSSLSHVDVPFHRGFYQKFFSFKDNLSSTVPLDIRFKTTLPTHASMTEAHQENCFHVLLWALPVLLQHFSLDDITLAIGCVLAEKKIIVQCADVSVMSACVMALVYLLAPFRWVSPVVVIVPSHSHYVDLFDIPCPAILGTPIIPQGKGTDEGVIVMKPDEKGVYFQRSDVVTSNAFQLPFASKIKKQLQGYASTILRIKRRTAIIGRLEPRKSNSGAYSAASPSSENSPLSLYSSFPLELDIESEDSVTLFRAIGGFSTTMFDHLHKLASTAVLFARNLATASGHRNSSPLPPNVQQGCDFPIVEESNCFSLTDLGKRFISVLTETQLFSYYCSLEVARQQAVETSEIASNEAIVAVTKPPIGVPSLALVDNRFVDPVEQLFLILLTGTIPMPKTKVECLKDSCERYCDIELKPLQSQALRTNRLIELLQISDGMLPGKPILWCNGRCNGRADTEYCTNICMRVWCDRAHSARHQIGLKEIIERQHHSELVLGTKLRVRLYDLDSGMMEDRIVPLKPRPKLVKHPNETESQFQQRVEVVKRNSYVVVKPWRVSSSHRKHNKVAKCCPFSSLSTVVDIVDVKSSACPSLVSDPYNQYLAVDIEPSQHVHQYHKHESSCQWIGKQTAGQHGAGKSDIALPGMVFASKNASPAVTSIAKYYAMKHAAFVTKKRNRAILLLAPFLCGVFYRLKFLKLRKAAIIIQRFARGHLVRSHMTYIVECLGEEKEWRLGVRWLACLFIRNWFRRHLDEFAVNYRSRALKKGVLFSTKLEKKDVFGSTIDTSLSSKSFSSIATPNGSQTNNSNNKVFSPSSKIMMPRKQSQMGSSQIANASPVFSVESSPESNTNFERQSSVEDMKIHKPDPFSQNGHLTSDFFATSSGTLSPLSSTFSPFTPTGNQNDLHVDDRPLFDIAKLGMEPIITKSPDQPHETVVGSPTGSKVRFIDNHMSPDIGVDGNHLSVLEKPSLEKSSIPASTTNAPLSSTNMAMTSNAPTSTNVISSNANNPSTVNNSSPSNIVLSSTNNNSNPSSDTISSSLDNAVSSESVDEFGNDRIDVSPLRWLGTRVFDVLTPQQRTILLKLYDMLRIGEEVIKFDRKGNPTTRYLYIDEKFSQLYWRSSHVPISYSVSHLEPSVINNIGGSSNSSSSNLNGSISNNSPPPASLNPRKKSLSRRRSSILSFFGRTLHMDEAEENADSNHGSIHGILGNNNNGQQPLLQQQENETLHPFFGNDDSSVDYEATESVRAPVFKRRSILSTKGDNERIVILKDILQVNDRFDDEMLKKIQSKLPPKFSGKLLCIVSPGHSLYLQLKEDVWNNIFHALQVLVMYFNEHSRKSESHSSPFKFLPSDAYD